MDTLTPLASALGLGMLAGARLYLTVFAVGLMLRLHWFTVPESWQHASVLADTRVLVLAGIASVIEFIADKVPWVDSAWDSVHTFIRPIGAALLTTSLFSQLSPAYQVMLFLLAGGMALSGHSSKAAARLVANHSPEPFTNLALSFGEDALVTGGLYTAARHPFVLAAIAVAFLVLFVWLAPRVYRALRAEAAAFGALLRKWTGGVRQPRLTSDQQQRIATYFPGRVPPRAYSVIATGDIKGLRHTLGTLCLTGNDALFLARRWRGPVEHRIGPLSAIEPRKGFFMDELVLVGTDGRRTRFDLLAGQFHTVAP